VADHKDSLDELATALTKLMHSRCHDDDDGECECCERWKWDGCNDCHHPPCNHVEPETQIYIALAHMTKGFGGWELRQVQVGAPVKGGS
jgi:hypothetical protein